MRNNKKIITGAQKVIPKNQVYFYTPQWQEGEIKTSEDIKKGRVFKAKNLKELFKKLDG